MKVRPFHIFAVIWAILFVLFCGYCGMLYGLAVRDQQQQQP